MVSHRLVARDFRAVYRLLNECRDLGLDARAWRTHLLQGLCRLTGCQVAIGSEFAGFLPGTDPRSLLSIRMGWTNEAAERNWLQYIQHVPMEATPEYAALKKRLGTAITQTRDQIWRGRDWHQSETYNLYHRPSGIDDYIMSIHSIPGTHCYSSLWLHRSCEDSQRYRSGRREWWIIHAVHSELVRLIGCELASAGRDSLHHLTPRQRQTLKLLLAGLSEKEAAHAMSISQATVHDHVVALHRHFEVCSRGELLSLFVRHSGAT